MTRPSAGWAGTGSRRPGRRPPAARTCSRTRRRSPAARWPRGVPKKSRIRARSSWTLSAEVSSTRSASSRSPLSRSRSAAIPSTTRPSSCSGCGRRTLSKRRTSVSSLASRNTTRGRMPREPSSRMLDCRSVENARLLRRSMTAAIRGRVPLARIARSIMVGSRPGGRLSMTNQSRSSRDLAVVLLPGARHPGDDHDIGWRAHHRCLVPPAHPARPGQCACFTTPPCRWFRCSVRSPGPAPANACVSRRPPAAGFTISTPR